VTRVLIQTLNQKGAVSPVSTTCGGVEAQGEIECDSPDLNIKEGGQISNGVCINLLRVFIPDFFRSTERNPRVLRQWLIKEHKHFWQS